MRAKIAWGIVCSIPVVAGLVWLALPQDAVRQAKVGGGRESVQESADVPQNADASEVVDGAPVADPLPEEASAVETTAAEAPVAETEAQVDPSLLVAASFEQLREGRDATVEEWRARLLALRDPASVDAFVEGVMGFAAKIEFAADLLTLEGPERRLVGLMKSTIGDNRQLADELCDDVAFFQKLVQAEVWNLLSAAGMSDAEIAPLLNEAMLREMTVRHAGFQGLYEDAVAALAIDAGRFAANWWLSGEVSSGLVDLGQAFGIIDEDPNSMQAFLLGTGMDYLVGDALDQLTDFSAELRRAVVRRLIEVEEDWTDQLEETLDAILSNYRQACETALSNR